MLAALGIRHQIKPRPISSREAGNQDTRGRRQDQVPAALKLSSYKMCRPQFRAAGKGRLRFGRLASRFRPAIAVDALVLTAQFTFARGVSGDYGVVLIPQKTPLRRSGGSRRRIVKCILAPENMDFCDVVSVVRNLL